MLEMRSETVFTLSDDIVLKVLSEADKCYAFNTRNGDHFVLNQTAQWVLEALTTPIPMSDLIRDFAEEYQITCERARADLLEIIGFGVENCIIEEVCCEEESNDQEVRETKNC